MGISCFSSGGDGISVEPIKAPNPNPYKYKIISIQFCAETDKLLLKVKYEGCTTHKGIKLLLFSANISKEILKRISCKNCLDPHFLGDKYSPIARFPPTKEGIMLAELCLRSN